MVSRSSFSQRFVTFFRVSGAGAATTRPGPARPARPSGGDWRPGAIALAAGLAIAAIGQPAAAEPDPLRRLLQEGECAGCDLRSAGLVYANLANADLQGADLRGANLSRANLQGANLQGADLRGATLFGANLTLADLQGANLRGADLRETFLNQANVAGADWSGAALRGASGIPSGVVDAQTHFNWGVREAERRNFSGAIAYYNQALDLDPNFASAYLNRAVARAKLADYDGALADARRAETLFANQNDSNGETLAQEFHTGLEDRLEDSRRAERGGNGIGITILNFVQGVGSFLVPLLF